MMQFIPERLVSARILKGFSLQDLSERLGTLTKQSLHKYESGEVTPNKEVISQIADILDVGIHFFFTPQRIELSNPEFRKSINFSSKDEYRIKEVTRLYLSNYLELEEIIGLATDFHNPLEHIRPVTGIEAINHATELLRTSWGIGTDPIPSVVNLLEENNIKIVEVEADDDFDGMQARVNDKFPVIVINKNKKKTDDRKRFTILHELGHALLHLDHLPLAQREKLCNQFASAMLFPQVAMRKELGTFRNRIHLHEFGALKKQYGVSIQAMIMRAKDLSIISENYCKVLFSYIRQQGWKVDEPYSFVGNENLGRFEQLLYRALIEKLISIEKAAILSNKTVDEFSSELFL